VSAVSFYRVWFRFRYAWALLRRCDCAGLCWAIARWV
jgi:hypothetical protein